MIDVIYLAWNRVELTKVTFGLVLDNTDWDLVRHLIVYEDGSTDGTREYLDVAVARARVAGVDASLSYLGFGSPVRTMNWYLEQGPAPLFAKIDNDIACPPGWLNRLNDVMESSPQLEILGMQAGMADPTAENVAQGWTPCSHIGGVGLMRSAAFLNRPRMTPAGRFGFTQWQQREEPVRGWITPDLPCIQMDLLPFEPWASLSRSYAEQGWQREWPPYAESSHELWDWIPNLEGA